MSAQIFFTIAIINKMKGKLMAMEKFAIAIKWILINTISLDLHVVFEVSYGHELLDAHIARLAAVEVKVSIIEEVNE